MNHYDSGAIKVMRLNGEQLGFIPAYVSRGGDPTGLASRMDRGGKFQCWIKDLNWGGEGYNRGVNIEVAESESDDVLPVDTTTPVPIHTSSGLGWLFFAAAALLLLILTLIHNSS
jgi:hypothetical protein